MVTSYQPDIGHFVHIDCDPQAGMEQAGRRPALVVSPASFSIATGLLWACPVTHQVKGSPFEVRIPAGSVVTGAVLVSHKKSFDWRRRNPRFIAVAPRELIDEVIAKAVAIMDWP